MLESYLWQHELPHTDLSLYMTARQTVHSSFTQSGVTYCIIILLLLSPLQPDVARSDGLVDTFTRPFPWLTCSILSFLFFYHPLESIVHLVVLSSSYLWIYQSSIWLIILKVREGFLLSKAEAMASFGEAVFPWVTHKLSDQIRWYDMRSHSLNYLWKISDARDFVAALCCAVLSFNSLSYSIPPPLENISYARTFLRSCRLNRPHTSHVLYCFAIRIKFCDQFFLSCPAPSLHFSTTMIIHKMLKGDDRMLIERFIEDPHHIEIQVS